MPDHPFYTIRVTTDAGHYDAGAAMMVQTDPWITLGFDYAACRKAFDGPCKEVFIIETANGLAGFAILQVCGTFNGYIQTICMAASERNKGLGKVLLAFCEKRILLNSPNIFICVSSFNEGAKRLYLSLGFETVGLLKNFIKEGFDEWLLRKSAGARMGYKR